MEWHSVMELHGETGPSGSMEQGMSAGPQSALDSDLSWVGRISPAGAGATTASLMVENDGAVARSARSDR